jgi:hypothetical protein
MIAVNGLFVLAVVVAAAGTWLAFGSEDARALMSKPSTAVRADSDRDEVFENPYAVAPRPVLRVIHGEGGDTGHDRAAGRTG